MHAALRIALTSPRQGGGAPAGFIYLIDTDGAYLLDQDGARLMEAL